MFNDNKNKKSFGEKLMNICGMYWWPPTHNDPRIKGPKPRLITREQYEALMKLKMENGECKIPDVVEHDS